MWMFFRNRRAVRFAWGLVVWGVPVGPRASLSVGCVPPSRGGAGDELILLLFWCGLPRGEGGANLFCCCAGTACHRGRDQKSVV